jgi:hypothetical protein
VRVCEFRWAGVRCENRAAKPLLRPVQHHGNFWIASVRVVDFVTHVVNVDMKCFRRPCGAAAEEDGAASSRDLFQFHAVRLEPCGNLRGTGLRDPERLAKLFGS